MKSLDSFSSSPARRVTVVVLSLKIFKNKNSGFPDLNLLPVADLAVLALGDVNQDLGSRMLDV